jgi:osmotically-inducible protein OsmY
MGEQTMNKYSRALAIAALAGATLAGTGCAVMRGQETAGAYVDDTATTSAVKAKFVEDKTVDAAAIKVETLNGTVQLSGFAKSSAEKAQAEYLARNTKGVRSVKNNIEVRP